MKNKMECQINLDQLKTLILIKGEEKRVGRFLPSFISLTITFPICFSSVYSIVPPNLPTTWRSPSSTEPPHLGRRESHWTGDWCRLRWKIRLRKRKEGGSQRTLQVSPLEVQRLPWKRHWGNLRKNKERKWTGNLRKIRNSREFWNSRSATWVGLKVRVICSNLDHPLLPHPPPLPCWEMQMEKKGIG